MKLATDMHYDSAENLKGFRGLWSRLTSLGIICCILSFWSFIISVSVTIVYKWCVTLAIFLHFHSVASNLTYCCKNYWILYFVGISKKQCALCIADKHATWADVSVAGVVRYKYDWKLTEAAKNIMRTHTTGVSARMLYQLAQQVCVWLFFALHDSNVVHSVCSIGPAQHSYLGDVLKSHSSVCLCPALALTF